MSRSHDAETTDFTLPPKTSPETKLPRMYSSLVLVDVGALSHVGKVRSRNEDHYLVSRTGRFLESWLTNLPEGTLPARFDETGYALLVADGMGGHAGGAMASQLAITTLVNIVLNVPDWIMKPDDDLAEEMQKRAKDFYRQIDEILNDRGEQDPGLFGMGTTMTLAYSLGPDLFITHIGDSRAYLFREGRLEQLTRDQTLVQEMADMGAISQEEAATHRLRNVLIGVLGGNNSNVPVQVRRTKLTDGDRLLLCTDGLTDLVNHATITDLLARLPSSQEACQALLDEALDRGGKDNVTVVLARYRMPPGERPGTAPPTDPEIPNPLTS
jgi:serine/threonine protein phosphatase PrpC